jgi:hypothetical protein
MLATMVLVAVLVPVGTTDGLVVQQARVCTSDLAGSEGSWGIPVEKVNHVDSMSCIAVPCNSRRACQLVSKRALCPAHQEHVLLLSPFPPLSALYHSTCMDGCTQPIIQLSRQALHAALMSHKEHCVLLVPRSTHTPAHAVVCTTIIVHPTC